MLKTIPPCRSTRRAKAVSAELPARREPLQQLAVGQTGERARVEERAERVVNRAGTMPSHDSSPVGHDRNVYSIKATVGAVCSIFSRTRAF